MTESYLLRFIFAFSALTVLGCSKVSSINSTNTQGGYSKDKKCEFLFDQDMVVSDLDLDDYFGNKPSRKFHFFGEFNAYQNFKRERNNLKNTHKNRRWIQLSDVDRPRNIWSIYFYSYDVQKCELDFIKYDEINGETSLKIGNGFFKKCLIPEYFLNPEYFALGKNAGPAKVTLAHRRETYLNWGDNYKGNCGRKVHRSANLSWLGELRSSSWR